MAIILSSLLYARVLKPLHHTPHGPFLSLLWAVWTLIEEPCVRTMDGRQCEEVIHTDGFFHISLLNIMHYRRAVPLCGVTHVRVGRRFAQVLLSATVSVCLPIFLLFLAPLLLLPLRKLFFCMNVDSLFVCLPSVLTLLTLLTCLMAAFNSVYCSTLGAIIVLLTLCRL